MLTLYVKTGCPFCAKVLATLAELGTPFEAKNIKDPKVVEELLAEGGKRQGPFLEDDNMTPYLVDDDVEMYESDAIVAYLKKKYRSTTAKIARAVASGDIRLHIDDDSDVCESCQ